MITFDLNKNWSKPVKINPECLKALRDRKRWSRQKLADRSNVSARQIARIENSKTSMNVRENTLTRLSKALHVDEDVLISSEPVGPKPPPPPDVQVSFRISPQVRLAYDLVEYRYGPKGPSHKDLFNLAPLLFVLLAEGCLAWRRQHIEEVEEVMDRLTAFGKKWRHLYFTYQKTNLELGLFAEQDSIAAADLRGDILRNGDNMELDFAEDALYKVAPFADYLHHLAEELGIPDVFKSGADMPDDLWGAEPYQPCQDELNEITGGSKHARWALENGDVRLSDIPKELMPKQARDKRIDWLESRLSDRTQKTKEERERIADLLASLIEEENDENN